MDCLRHMDRFSAGYAETSSVSFLAGYSLSAGYALTAATLLISVFGIGGTALQLPIGWMADRSSYSKLEEGYRSYTYFQSKPSTANSIVRLPSL